MEIEGHVNTFTQNIGDSLEMPHENPHEMLSTRSKKQPQVRNPPAPKVLGRNLTKS